MELVRAERCNDQQHGGVEWFGDQRGTGVNQDSSESQRRKRLNDVDRVTDSSVHRGHARESDDRAGVDGAIHRDRDVFGPEHTRPDKGSDVELDQPGGRDDQQFDRIKWSGYFGECGFNNDKRNNGINQGYDQAHCCTGGRCGGHDVSL